jgi:hypothetical protein
MHLYTPLAAQVAARPRRNRVSAAPTPQAAAGAAFGAKYFGDGRRRHTPATRRRSYCNLPANCMGTAQNDKATIQLKMRFVN